MPIGQIPWNKGKTGVYLEETLEKMRNAKLGKSLSKEHKMKISFANLGKHLESPTKESREKMRIAHLRENLSDETLQKMSIANSGRPSPMKGKHHSEETKEKIGLGHLGNIPWNKNKHFLKEIIEKMSESHKGHLVSEETKRKISIAISGENNHFYGKRHTEESKEKNRIAHSHYTKEVLKKILCRRIPTSLEEKFQSIVDKHNLPYKYVGDGSFIIGRYNPDFINTNSEKIAIEVYARYYKKRNHISIEDWKIQRSEVFKQYGWEIVYFNEIEVNEENILNKLNKVKK